ncbi:hypothetical protein ACHAPA_006027 [Fusarium lateritium]
MAQLRNKTRPYATVGGDDPAEFRSRKTAKDNTTMIIAGASAILIIALYGFSTARAKKNLDRDPKADPAKVGLPMPPPRGK